MRRFPKNSVADVGLFLEQVGSRGRRQGFNRLWTNGNGGSQSRGDALPFYSSDGIPIRNKSVVFPPRRPMPLPRIDSGLSSDAKFGGFEW